MPEKIKSTLTDVPETMLWTLHNRATEALRKDRIIEDEACIKIYQSIDYDYEKSFGKAEPSHALRSLAFDREVKKFLEKYPEGTIVNLGEGLETQRFRLKGNKALWISVDVPTAMAFRERFIQPDEQHLHCSVSALDRQWFDLVPPNQPVFITAQGLFMYLKEEEVKALMKDMFETFEGGYLMFDVIPRWMSNLSLKGGFKKTKDYTVPKLPWGINRNEFSIVLDWSSRANQFKEIDAYHYPRGFYKWFFGFFKNIPIFNRYIPTCVKVSFGQIQ